MMNDNLKIRIFLFTGLFLLIITALSGQSSTEKIPEVITQGPAKGYLVIVGGNLSDPAIYSRFLELAGGPNAKIVIIPTAGSDEYLFDKGGLVSIKERFQKNGFRHLTIIHTRDPKEANTDEFVKPIREATGLWFTGGRQWRLVDAYQNTKTYDEIVKLLARGSVVGGSSAGASIMGSFLVRGDTKTNTVMMGDHQKGFGLLTHCAIDQHLLALNRQFDLFEILHAHPELLGIGLDENTAIIVHGNEFNVIGKSYVAIYDGTFCQFVRDKADWNIEIPEITVLPEGSDHFYLLGAGRRYSLSKRKVIQ